MQTNVVIDGQSWCWEVYKNVLPVTKGDTPGAINPHKILVKFPDFHYNTGFTSFQGMQPRLVLDTDMIAYDKWQKPFSVFRPAFCTSHVAVSEGFLLSCEGLTPSVMRFVSARSYGNEVSNRATKDAHRRGELGISVWSVPVLKHGALKGISCEFRATIGCKFVRDIKCDKDAS